MIENLLELDIPPGLVANGTVYQSANRWREGNLVRFHEGTIQPIGGWRLRATTGATIAGSAQAAISWLLADGTPLFAVGTESGLYVIDNDEIVYDVTPTTGHAAPYNWHLSIFGTFLIATNTLLGDEDITETNVFVWEGDTAVAAVAAFTTALGPQGAYSAFVTPERFLTILRGKDPTDSPPPVGVASAYSERRVYWSSQEELDDFISTDTNTGGNFDLITDGRLVCGLPGRGQSLLWTDVDLWTMNFIGGELIYSFINAGSGCGIVGKRAAVVLNQGAYWMGRGKFFLYDGFVRTLPCDVTDAVFGDFNESQASSVWALANPRYNEVTWFYPSVESTTPDRYVTYNYLEGHWTNGQLRRSAGVPQRFRRDIVDAPVPSLFDGALLYDHETGSERASQAFLTSGPVQLGAGDRLMRLQGVLPDDKNVGDVQLRLYTSMSPDALETLRGPFSLSAYTPVRTTARQIRVRLEETGATSWRVGKVRLAVLPAERRGPGVGAPNDTTAASIEVIPNTVTLIDQQHYTFTAIIKNAAGQVLDLVPDGWASDDSADVSIDDTGTVTAINTPATAHITATLGALTSNSATVTVAGSTVPASITVTPTPDSVVVNLTSQLTAVVKNAAGMVLTRSIDSWTSDDTSVATVDGTGLVTGVAFGTCSVHAAITTPAVTSNAAAITATDSLILHEFTSTGTFAVTSGGEVDYLVIGAGGDGGAVGSAPSGGGGGGGGGGVKQGAQTIPPASYTATIGSSVSLNFPTSVGATAGSAPATFHGGNPGAGDPGGGNGGVSVVTTFAGSTAFGDGGGGGAAGAGTDGTSPNSSTGTGGNGGAGVLSSVTGTPIRYGGGGAGAGTTANGTPGDGGGAVGQDGTRFGGGGGDQGGHGAPGVVYISYLLSKGVVATGGVVTVVPRP